MPTIYQLPQAVINKIAAGEVIERPASVVKELVENAVDSGAGRIDVTLGQGGASLVRVSDDGCGIASDQIKLAVASHATSKIRSADDLFHVRTLGFRGEALASIAEISQFLIRSRTPEDNAGTELAIHGGAMSEPEPCGAPVGTTVEVRNVFFNTPVRRKFLRTTQTEMGHASEAFTRIALAHPQIHFTLKHNEKTVYDLPPVDAWRSRIAAFFGSDISDSLIPIESDDGAVRLFGYAADPHYSRGNNRMQYLFLNGRHIRDRALGHALGEAYRGLLLTGRHPIAFLQIQMPPDAVDVNVHPTKLEVRFAEGGRIYSQLLGSLRKKFLATDLTARVKTPPIPEESEDQAHDADAAERHRRELVEWAKGQLTPSAATPSAQSPGDAVRQQSLELPSGPMLEFTQLEKRWSAEAPHPNGYAGTPPTPTTDEPSPEQQYTAHPGATAPPRPMAMQIQNRYLITEDSEGMVVIDQHALHERILYEQLRTKVLDGNVETQRLLVPEPVTLSGAEAAAAIEAAETLSQIGIEIEPFGGDTVLVTGYPAMLANLPPEEMLRRAIEQIMSSGKAPDQQDMVDELLHMMSCKAAVKAGDKLSPEEISELLARRDLCQDAHHCPHGRPTALVFTRQQLDKMFKRT